MPTIQFIDVNPEQIIADTIAQYEAATGTTVYPADAERILIDVMAYREQAILAKMETAMHQNFVQLANGFALDYWGELFGVLRNANEEDDDYRVRIIAQSKFQPVGTRTFYISKIKEVSHVSDVKLISKQDDPSVPPGIIAIVVIEKDTTVVNHVQGIAMDINLTTKTTPILAVLNDWQVNLIGDMFIFQSAVAIQATGTLVVKKKIGVNPVQLQMDIQEIVDQYFYDLSLSFDNEFGNNDLARKIMEHPDVLSIQTNLFPNLPIKQYKEFWTKGVINLSVI